MPLHGRTKKRRALHQMTTEELARDPHAEVLRIKRSDMPKLSQSQTRAIQEASNRTRRRAVMKGVRSDQGAFVGSVEQTDARANESAKTMRFELAELLMSDPTRAKGRWRAEDVAAVIEIRRRCVCLALDWTAPAGTPTTASNAELVAMNAYRFIDGTQKLWVQYGFVGNARAWDIMADVIAEEVPAYRRVRLQSGLWLAHAKLTDDSMFERLWLQSAFARLEIGHQLAAALCCTDVPEHVEVRAPWAAWSLIVPDGLLDPWAGSRVWCLGTEWIATVRKDGHVEPPAPGLVGDMVRSLIRGACLAITEPENHRKPVSKASHSHGTNRHSGAPNFEQARFLLAKPVSIDLREHVAAAAAGRTHSAPKVQFLVRGHWREQAHGPKLSLRKTLWIEPFWKGPEESRILLRSHAVKEGE